MKAIIIRQHGDPTVLRMEECPMPQPQPTEVLIKNHAIGVNFVDTQHRAGVPYPIGLPLIPGIEGAGTVVAVGATVTEFRPGDRVAYAGYMGGNYAEYTALPEERVVPLPSNVSTELAAAGLMQAMTAHCLIQSAYPVQAGDLILIQAGAGGVGLQLIQLAKRAGETVIATVSTEAKAALASAFGADYVIDYTKVDFMAETLRLTADAGVHAIYDGVGQATFDRGIQLLRPRGVMVLYGLASGTIPPFDINRLSGITGSGNRGSLFLTWATLGDYTATRAALRWRASEVLQWLGDGTLRVHLHGTVPLANASEAHRLLESRQSAGKLLLVP